MADDCVANDPSRLSAYGIDADDVVKPYTLDEIKFMKAWKKALNQHRLAEAKAQAKRDREERKHLHGSGTIEAPAGQPAPDVAPTAPRRPAQARQDAAVAETRSKDTENDPEGRRIVVYRLPGKGLSVLAQVLYGELRNIQRKTRKNPVYVKQEVLANNWGVTSKTVRKALRELEREKLITHQRGTYGEVTCYEIL